MQLFLLIGFFACAFFNTTAALLPTYNHTAELMEKNNTLHSLLLHTYGPQNPFLELTATAGLCIESAEKAAKYAEEHVTQNTLIVHSTLQEFLHKFDTTISNLLRAFVESSPKETSLKELSELCHEATHYIETRPLPIPLPLRSSGGSTPHKFVLFDPAMVGGFGQLILKGIISLWCCYVLAQVYKYIVSENHEALDGIKEAHLVIYENIGETRKAINPYIPAHYRENIKLEVPKTETDWYNFWGRYKQYEARKKIIRAINSQATGIAKTLPDTPANRKLIKIWAESLKALSKEFRQNNA